MKYGAVKMLVRNVLPEIFAGDRRFLIEKFNADVAVVGFNGNHDVSLGLDLACVTFRRATVTRGRPARSL